MSVIDKSVVGKLYHVLINDTQNICAKTYDPPVEMPGELSKFLAAVQPHCRECTFYRTTKGIFGNQPLNENLHRFGDNGPEPVSYCPIPRYIGLENNILLVEHMEGYIVPDYYEGLTSTQAALATTALATLHNSTKDIGLDDPQLAPIVFPSHITWVDIHLFIDQLKQFDTAGGQVLSETCLDKIQNLMHMSDFGIALPSIDSTADCIIHGDCWSSNVMISADENSAILLDFQFAQRGQPVVDLACLYASSMHPDNRRGDALQQLCAAYNHRSLSLGGSVIDAQAVMAHMNAGLHLIVLSYDTWLQAASTQENKKILVHRYASVLEDVVLNL